MTLALETLPLTDSVVSRLDPRWKLAGIVILAGVAAVLQNLGPAALNFCMALVLAWLARLPLRWYLARLGFLAPFLGLFVVLLPFVTADADPWQAGPVALSRPGMRLALLLFLKALTVVTLILVLLATAPLQLNLQAAQSLRVPRIVVVLVLLTYRHVFSLIAELGRMRLALRVRGFRRGTSWHVYRTIGHVAGVLLVRGSERAERVNQAMRCRGFQGRFHSLPEFHTAGADLLNFFLILGCAAGLVVLDRVL